MTGRYGKNLILSSAKRVVVCILAVELLIHIGLRMVFALDKDSRRLGQSFWDAFLDYYSQNLLPTYAAVTVTGLIISIPFVFSHLLAHGRRLANGVRYCVRCGYSLTGLQGDQARNRCCPECGQEIPMNHEGGV